MKHELEPLLFSIVDAAKSLGVSHWTVRRLIADGQLPKVRIGSRVLLRASDLSEFVKERTEPGNPNQKSLLANGPTPR
jgi:excisionase family DNA binding protein